jgi:hypothetical protein
LADHSSLLTPNNSEIRPVSESMFEEIAILCFGARLKGWNIHIHRAPTWEE